MEIKTTRFKEWDYWYEEQCKVKKREIALKSYEERNDEESRSKCCSCKKEYIKLLDGKKQR